MGYTTTFKGQLRFTSELKASELAVLGQLFGEDCRDHPEWGATDLYYINLELTKDFSGLQWSKRGRRHCFRVDTRSGCVDTRDLWRAARARNDYVCQSN